MELRRLTGRSRGPLILRRASILLLATLSGASAARAADLAPSPALPPSEDPSLYDPRRMELRFGGFDHGVGSNEAKTADAKVEFVGPRLLPGVTAWWSALILRPYVSAVGNLDERTSSVRFGGLWTFPFTEHWFGEIFFGGAFHDGSIDGAPGMSALGAHTLFNIGGSLGYRIDRSWSLIGTFDHLSNGKSVFDLPHKMNQGLNSYGLELSYAFGPFF